MCTCLLILYSYVHLSNVTYLYFLNFLNSTTTCKLRIFLTSPLSVEERVRDSIANGGHGLLAAKPWAVPSKRVPVHNVCQLHANPATPEDF